MKQIERNPKSLQSHGIQNTVKFGIKASGLAHIFNVLRNQLYSDKIMAVVREYTCNAVDAHIDDDKRDLPIVVSLPTRLLPEFKVRDFGKGLTDGDIQDVYAFYGESTKRQSNEMIGQLGLGSKSAFAYGDNFVINSYIDGKKRIYNAFIDPSQIGQISKIGEENTSEENGIEIIVPVRNDDHTEFEEKAHVLFRHFPVKPTVKGADSRKFEYENPNVIFSGDNWKWIEVKDQRNYRSNSDGAIVVMGNIGYPVDEYALNLSHEDGLAPLLKENLIMNVPIGDLEISASREKLQYTDYTRQNLVRHLKAVKDGLVESVSKDFKQCGTLFDAKCLFGSVFDYASPLYSLRNILAKKLLWNGKQVDSDSYSVPSATWPKTESDQSVYLHAFNKNYRSSKFRCEESNSISCTKGTVVIENDIGHRRGIMGRILPLLLDEGKKPFIIQFPNAKVKAAWVKKVSWDGKMTLLSKLEKHKLSEFEGYSPVRNPDGSGAAKDVKHSAKCFTYNYDVGDKINRWSRAKSQYWNIAEADMDAGGVYILIDKFMVRGLKGYDQEPKRMSSLKDSCKEAGIVFPTVYAFKVGQRNKVEGKSQWTTLWDYMKKQLKLHMETTDLTQRFLDRTAALEFVNTRRNDRLENLNHLSTFLTTKQQWNSLDNKLADKDGTFAKFADALAFMHGCVEDTKGVDVVRGLAKDFGLTKDFESPKAQKTTHNLLALGKKLMDKYPMIAWLDYQHLCGWKSGEKKFLTDIANYINVIDICSSSPAE
jgi:hypothetical protein